VNDGRITERHVARTDAIGAWVCRIGVMAAVVLVLVYTIKG
jgi:hypothetical protein